MEIPILKTSSTIFDRSKITFDRSKIASIDPKTLWIDRVNQKLLNWNWNIFDRSKISFDRSKFWKNEFFEKHSNFSAATSQSIKFYEKNAWVWDEMFSKNTWIQPRFLKSNFSFNTQKKIKQANVFCINFQKFSNLVGQTKEHTLTCTQFSKE